MSEILLDSLKVKTWIGVPDAERMEAQEVEVDLRIRPARNFVEMQDEIALTVDYAAVCQRVAALAAERPRRLIETLAREIGMMVLSEFDAASVDVEIRKFILPEPRHVGGRWSGGEEALK
ncbi:MAG: dihydroneopterin aldolase [Spartobacteria bacterium]